MNFKSVRKVLQRFTAVYAGDRRGQVSIIVAASSVALMSAVGGNIDASVLQTEQARLQSSVDAAALHAVREVMVHNATDAEADAAAERVLDANFGSGNVSTQVDPELVKQVKTETEVLSRDPAQLKISATRVIELPFGVLGQKHVLVTRTAQSVEALKTPLTLLILDRTASSAWRASGTSGVVALEGAAIVNSSSPAALDGGGNAEIVTAGTLVVGPEASASNWTPKPQFRASPVNDPYKNKVRWPQDPPCEESKRNVRVKNQTVTLQPGVYCGGLELQTHANVTLAPGTYILKDGPLLVTANSKLTAPENVSIVMIGEAAYTNFQAGSEVTIKAPKTGDWKNIAIAIKPQSIERQSTIIGGGELTLDGVLYYPSQKVVVTGGGSADVITGSRILIANRLETAGNGEIYLRGNAEVATVNLGARLER